MTCAGMQAKHDLLAVGYSQTEAGAKSPGRLALWSLKNPGHPLWELSMLAPVTALDFSRQIPHLLAVGCADGAIAMYDAKARQVLPCLLVCFILDSVDVPHA